MKEYRMIESIQIDHIQWQVIEFTGYPFSQNNSYMSSFEKSTSYHFLLDRFNVFINVGSERNKRKQGSITLV